MKVLVVELGRSPQEWVGFRSSAFPWSGRHFRPAETIVTAPPSTAFLDWESVPGLSVQPPIGKFRDHNPPPTHGQPASPRSSPCQAIERDTSSLPVPALQGLKGSCRQGRTATGQEDTLGWVFSSRRTFESSDIEAAILGRSKSKRATELSRAKLRRSGALLYCNCTAAELE